MFNLAVSIQGIHDGVCNVVQASPSAASLIFRRSSDPVAVQTAQRLARELTISGSPTAGNMLEQLVERECWLLVQWSAVIQAAFGNSNRVDEHE